MGFCQSLLPAVLRLCCVVDRTPFPDLSAVRVQEGRCFERRGLGEVGSVQSARAGEHEVGVALLACGNGVGAASYVYRRMYVFGSRTRGRAEGVVGVEDEYVTATQTWVCRLC